MASFKPGGALKTPFGKNVYLRSTAGLQFEHYTLAAASVPFVTIDGFPQRILQPGTVLAKITSGPDSGKVGPFQASGTAEIQTITVTGTPTGGAYTLTFSGQTTAPIPYNATAAQVQAALEALPNIGPGSVLAAGGPHPGTAITVTFFGFLTGDVPQMTTANTFTGGSTPAVTVATSTGGVAGAADGRQTLANIVGLNDTFLPWQLLERDVEVAALYHGTAVQAWCIEYNAAGLAIALTNTTADAMRSVKGMDITFK